MHTVCDVVYTHVFAVCKVTGIAGAFLRESCCVMCLVYTSRWECFLFGPLPKLFSQIKSAVIIGWGTNRGRKWGSQRPEISNWQHVRFQSVRNFLLKVSLCVTAVVPSRKLQIRFLLSPSGSPNHKQPFVDKRVIL